MKPLAVACALTSVILAGPTFSGSDKAETCEAKFSEVSQAWAEWKSERDEDKEVTVSTNESDLEVTAEDAKPTENWFGKPPSDKTVEGYLESAKEAMNSGDEAACFEQLKNVEDAMNVGN